MPLTGFTIALSDRGPLCAAGNKASSTTLVLNFSSANTPLATGTYPVAPTTNGPLSASSRYYVLDAACARQPSLSHDGVSGSIVVSAITAAAVTGTYDVTFENGSRLSGAFDAPLCDLSSIAGPKVCVP